MEEISASIDNPARSKRKKATVILSKRSRISFPMIRERMVAKSGTDFTLRKTGRMLNVPADLYNSKFRGGAAEMGL